jgi:hypothetical protein
MKVQQRNKKSISDNVGNYSTDQDENIQNYLIEEENVPQIDNT